MYLKRANIQVFRRSGGTVAMKRKMDWDKGWDETKSGLREVVRRRYI